jgi:hypothetical protein
MSVGIGRQNIIILFWKLGGCTVSFLGSSKLGTRHLCWILTGPSFAVQCKFVMFGVKILEEKQQGI